MKKRLSALLLTSTMLLSLASCGAQTPGSASGTSQSAQTSSPAADTVQEDAPYTMIL